MTDAQILDLALPASTLVLALGALAILRPSPNRHRFVVRLLLATGFLMLPVLFGGL